MENEQKKVKGSGKYYVGPMHAKKTLKLIQDAKKALATPGLKCLAISPTNDTRYSGDFIQSRRGDCLPALKVNPDLSLFDCSLLKDMHTIFIDEMQFFTHLFPFVEAARNKGIHVVGTGLDTNCLRQCWDAMRPFLDPSYLEANDNVTIRYLKSNCTTCKKPKSAIWTARKKSAPTASSMIDPGNDQYFPLCDSCWKEPIQA